MVNSEVDHVNDAANDWSRQIIANVSVAPTVKTVVAWQNRIKLKSCIVLNEHNTVFARSGPLYVISLSLGPYDITACTVVQAVVKATSQSNGKGQILTPWGSKTPERISMKLGLYNRVAGMPAHANPRGAATT